jgi:hypothetical protein
MADLLASGTKNALDFYVARRAEEQARTSERMAAAAHRLNILAAFFFPIITLTAILSVEFSAVAENFGIARDTAASGGTFAFIGAIVVSLLAGGIMTNIVSRPPRSGE